VYSDGTREGWEWSENDQLLIHVDRDGVITEWRYDSRWNCIEARRGGEVVLRASYDESNRLITSREGDRAELGLEYDERDFVIARAVTINGAKIREEWEIDAFGRVLKYTDGAGRVWEYTYTPNEIIENTPLGLQRRFLYNNRKAIVKISEKDTITGEVREQHRTYDRRRLLLEESDGAGNVTRYQYRADGELVRMERGPWFSEYGYDAGGRINMVTRGMAGSAARYTESYAYQLHGWEELRSITRPLSGMTTYRFDAWSRVTGITNALGESSSRTLNGAGNPVREQGASGGFYVYRYDAQGRMAEAGREGERAVQVRRNRDGTVAEMTDRLGNVTRYVYDGRGLLSREISGLGEERYAYDAAGRVIRRETASRNSLVYHTEWAYNDANRTVTVTAGGLYTETLHLNAWGEIVRRMDGTGNERRFEYDGAGRLLKAIDGYGRATSYSWNELGSVTLITHADGTVVHYEYDHLGNLTEVRDILGVSWAGEYDQSGRLVKETGRPGINREYSYDALGRVVEVKNGGEVVERYQYTNRGREIVFTDDEGGNFSQQKNTYGELISEMNRMGDIQRFNYDAEGRLISRSAFSEKLTRVEYRAVEGLTITTFNDGVRTRTETQRVEGSPLQNIIERDLAGNIIKATNETGTIRYRYDAGGRLVEQIDERAGETTRYSYDRAGRRIRMQSGNRDVHYSYGRNGKLLRVSDNSQRLDVRYEYDMRGRETRRVYGNGVRQETAYDAIGRVIMIRELDSRNNLLRAEGYLYDEAGRRSHNVDEQGLVTKYEYDGQSRLSTVLYPWTREKAEAGRREAEEAGLFFTPDRGNGERYSFNAAELNALREVLNRAGPARGNAITSSQLLWREAFSYDRNGNRAAKTTPWGIINYEYDAENRLVRKGDIEYINDRDGNMLSARGLRYEANYSYNGHNRMVYSEVTSQVERTHAVSFYGYDALGRRTITGNVTGQAIRTLYDGRSFEVIREGETFRDGSLTTRFAPDGAIAGLSSSQPTGERYRWVGDGESSRTRTVDGYTAQGSRHGGRSVTLYGNGEAIAVSYSSGTESRSMYLGKDILGSVRSATVDTGTLEARYEYDAFGQPHMGDLSGMMNLGYLSKPFDTVTGLYNYGFRDYKPRVARFSTVDPIRDGNNWFAYVNNDPVNWIDLWGLCAVENRSGILQNVPEPAFFMQGQFANSMGQGFAATACTATALLNAISTEFTNQTGLTMTQLQGEFAMMATANQQHINNTNGFVNNWEAAANTMWSTTGQTGTWTYNEKGQHQIHAIDKDRDGTPDHFVNDIGGGKYRDTRTGNTGNVEDLNRQEGRETRGFDFNNWE
jgi:RHS repeat-associated protein